MFSRSIIRTKQYATISRSLSSLSTFNSNKILQRVPVCVISHKFTYTNNYFAIRSHNLVRFKTTESEKKISEDEPPKPLSNAQKLKKAVAEYGTTVIVFHVGISLVSLGSCYLAVSAGLDVNEILYSLGLKEWAIKSSLVSNAGTFAVAYAIHKVFAPVRIAITLGSVPLIVRYLRNKGFLRK